MATIGGTNPRHFGASNLNYLAESNVDTSRDAIKTDLVDKIVYDDPAVFRRLRISDVPYDIVESCAPSLSTANHRDIALLKKLAAAASAKDPDELDEEEKARNMAAQSGNQGTSEEKRMYAPLVRLFTHITNFGGAPSPRKFENTKGMLRADEPHTFGFPSVSPDLTLSEEGVDATNSKKWRHRDGFGEIKPSNKQGPKPVVAGTIPHIVTQCADYARLFMSARPFMLFCVGVLIFGTKFCVGIFDRDGITFSPIYDMFDDIYVLIRVVRSLACQLTIEELGLDPTVRVLDDQQTMELTGQHIYPSAVVKCAHRDWCTIGSPIWVSLSFLGRGTNVWRVKEYILDKDLHPRLEGNTMVMKTAWRSSARTSESDIYSSIEQPYPVGLAEFECGGDVEFPSTRFPITVRNLRAESTRLDNANNSPATPHLHRLILRTVGRPMWEYNSDKDLLNGFREAFQAHKYLCDKGILHRDISAGNVLLHEELNGGFIADVELALIQKPTMQKSSVVSPITCSASSGVAPAATTHTHTTFESTIAVKRGSGMSGTAQFISRAILEASENTIHIMHEAAHDIESFIWVLSYCVMRNLITRASKATPAIEVQEQCEHLRVSFKDAFGQRNNFNIASQRQSRSAALFFPEQRRINKIITSFMDIALVTLFKDLRILIHRSDDILNPVLLTHDDLLGVVDKAIASLR